MTIMVRKKMKYLEYRKRMDYLRQMVFESQQEGLSHVAMLYAEGIAELAEKGYESDE